MAIPEIIIRLVENEDELRQMYYVRWSILRQPLGLALGTEQDEYDQESFQMIALYNSQIIGCARLNKISQDAGNISYVAVLPEFRQQGIGTKLIKKLVEVAQQENLRRVSLKARLQSVNFYKKLGFKETEEPFEFLGIPHIKMFFEL